LRWAHAFPAGLVLITDIGSGAGITITNELIFVIAFNAGTQKNGPSCVILNLALLAVGHFRGAIVYGRLIAIAILMLPGPFAFYKLAT